MKSILTGFICLICLFLESQSISTLFPSDSLTWVERHIWTQGNPSPAITEYRTYHLGNDTFINNQNYKTVYLDNYWFVCALRVDSNRVYKISPNSLNEELLYDFGLQLGDTLWNVNGSFCSSGGIISNILMDTINNVARKKFTISPLPPVNGVCVFHIIEGIGSNTQILYPFTSMIMLDNDYRVICFNHRNINYLSEDGSCVIANSLEDLYDESSLQLYPNPASTQLTCRLSQLTAETSLRIESVDGKTVHAIHSIEKELTQIDISMLPAGLYFLTMQNGQQRVVKKFVKE